jgi:hypothetical protein
MPPDQHISNPVSGNFTDTLGYFPALIIAPGFLSFGVQRHRYDQVEVMPDIIQNLRSKPFSQLNTEAGLTLVFNLVQQILHITVLAEAQI